MRYGEIQHARYSLIMVLKVNNVSVSQKIFSIQHDAELLPDVLFTTYCPRLVHEVERMTVGMSCCNTNKIGKNKLTMYKLA